MPKPALEAAATTADEVAVDDPTGQLLWMSPTSGPPISLAWMPAGAQCLVHFRPAQLTAHPEGEKVLTALGPWGHGAIDELRALVGAELAELDAVTLAIVVGDDGKLATCLRVELVEAWDEDDLARRIPNGRMAGEYRVVGDRAYWLPAIEPGRAGRTLVTCPTALAADLMELAGEAPQLVRDLEALVAQTDAERGATIILAPRFLDASGSRLLSDTAVALREALRWLIDADATAVALSADLRQDLYIELRAAPALNVTPRRLAAALRERVSESAVAVESVLASQPWEPYGREVLAKYPGMLRTLASYSRAGEEHKQAVVNCYLPSVAGHNLLMATELLLTQSRGSAAPGELPTREETVAERLAKPTSLSFAKDTLQRAIELLADDIGIEIRIEGRDLQADGITKNQSFAIDLRDRPAREILVEILRRANPDLTAEGPADPRQKLVYVVETTAGGAAGRIIVTTRAAAEKRHLPLPAEFLGTGR